MPISPSWKNWSISAWSNTAFLIHLFGQRTNLVVGKLADVVAEQNLVFGKSGERSGIESCRVSGMKIPHYRDALPRPGRMANSKL